MIVLVVGTKVCVQSLQRNRCLPHLCPYLITFLWPIFEWRDAMKLFDDFDVVKFTEENLLFIAKNEYLYYIYNPKYERWNKHRNAGNDSITVANYVDVPQ